MASNGSSNLGNRPMGWESEGESEVSLLSTPMRVSNKNLTTGPRQHESSFIDTSATSHTSQEYDFYFKVDNGGHRSKF
jgi:hypothetical protein